MSFRNKSEAKIYVEFNSLGFAFSKRAFGDYESNLKGTVLFSQKKGESIYKIPSFTSKLTAKGLYK